MKKIGALLIAFSMILTLTSMIAFSTQDTFAATEESEADDTVYELSASFHSPETNSSVVYTMQWCEEVAKASGGRIHWTYYTSGSLTSSADTFAHARDGVADVTWTTPVLVGAQMKANSLMVLPGSGWPINEDGGAIAWEMFESSPELQKEWEGVKVISYYPMGATVLAFNDKMPESAEDMKGMNYRATNLVTSAFVESLGANPVIISTSDAYENLQKNVVAGSLIDWNLYNSFHLYDVMKYAVGDNLYSNIGNIVMNIDTYNSLPEDLQAIIDEYSGEYASKLGGKITAEMDENSMNSCIENGVTVTPASDTLKEEINTAAAKALEVYYADCEEAGVDGEALVDQFSEIMEKYGYTCPLKK